MADMKAKRWTLPRKAVWRNLGRGPRKENMNWADFLRLMLFRSVAPPGLSALIRRQARIPGYQATLNNHRSLRRHLRWGAR